MKFLKHTFLLLLIFSCWVAIIACVAAYTFLTTSWGAKVASTYLLESYMPFCNVSVGEYEGTIEKGLLLKNVTLSHIPNLKKGIVYIHDLYVQVPLIHWDQISLKINNATINLPSADPIVFNGTLSQNKIQGNAYAHSIDARQMMYTLGYDDLAKNLYGFISNLDFVISGTAKAPRFTGHFFVDKFIFKNTQLSDGFGHLDLTILSLGDDPALKGFVILESASIKVNNKINVDLTTSKVEFKGKVNDFLLDIHGSSKIEDINIDMAIKGSFLKPQLVFSSDPPMSEEQILMTLATGKSWSGIDDGQGVGLRKKLTDTFNVGMQVEERQTQVGRDQTQGYSKTLEGQMKMTDKFSLNIAKKYLPANGESTSGIGATSQPQKDNDSEIYLQYKQRF